MTRYPTTTSVNGAGERGKGKQGKVMMKLRGLRIFFFFRAIFLTVLYHASQVARRGARTCLYLDMDMGGTFLMHCC